MDWVVVVWLGGGVVVVPSGLVVGAGLVSVVVVVVCSLVLVDGVLEGAGFPGALTVAGGVCWQATSVRPIAIKANFGNVGNDAFIIGLSFRLPTKLRPELSQRCLHF